MYVSINDPSENLLEQDKVLKIHVRIMLMFEVKNGLPPKIVSDMFKFCSPTYNMRNERNFVSDLF